MDYRIEKDLLGEKRIPHHVYWGIHTQRALENFALSAYRVNPRLIRALALVKKACAQTNGALGYIPTEKAAAICTACDEIASGALIDQFPLDALQGGAGTSTNMNINEVIASRAAELLGGTRGEYTHVHPLCDINRHQSTNDVYPTAVKVAAITAIRELAQTIEGLQNALQSKETAFAEIVTIGRTELQDAVPITLGAQFASFAAAIARDRWRMFKCEERLRVINLGGTAVGTGLGAPQQYIYKVNEVVRTLTGFGLARGEHGMDATANTDPFVEISGILKSFASNLIKIAGDIRLMNWVGDIRLACIQAGSSIMPGKVNPVICEAVIQVGLKVIANDSLITETASRSTFQINEFMPLLSHALLESYDILINATASFTRAIEQLTANPDQCRQAVDTSCAIITAFVPHIGYERATELIQAFQASGTVSLRAFLTEQVGAELVEKVLTPYAVTALGFKD